MTTATQTFDDLDQALLREIGKHFPIDHRPFQLLGRKLDIGEQECLRRIERLKEGNAIRQICAVFDARSLGYQRTLAAMRVATARVDAAAEIVGQYPGVSYTCRRHDPFNLWLTVAAAPNDSLEEIVDVLHTLARVEESILLPMLQPYKRGGKREPIDPADPWEGLEDLYHEKGGGASGPQPSEEDVRLIRILQEDLALIEMPFAVLAGQAKVSEEELFAWMRKAEHQGSMRRFAATLEEQRSRDLATALVVWQVPEELVDQVGEQMAQFREVDRCERRPVYASWPYPLFTLIHAQTAAECMDVVKRMEERVGRFTHKNLFTTKEYKQVRLKYFSPTLEEWWNRIGLPTLKERRGSAE